MKRYLLLTMPAIIAMASCRSGSKNVAFPVDSGMSTVSQPLTISKPEKIDWGSIKATPVKPIVEPFNLAKLPATVYDSSVFKPYPYPIKDSAFDFNSLPQKDFDIDKLPSQPIKFKHILLDPPKVTQAGPIASLKRGLNGLYRFGEAQGLSGVPLRILTDHNGFLWLSTTEALYRYDGENLMLFYKYDQPSYVNNLFEDSQGQIWIGGRGLGLASLNCSKGVLDLVISDADFNHHFWGMIQDENRRIWITQGNGMKIIDIGTERMSTLDKAHGLLENDAWGIAEDHDKNIWVTTYGAGTNIINPKNKKISYFTRQQWPNADSTDAARVDGKGRIWLSYRQHGNWGVAMFDEQLKYSRDVTLSVDHKTKPHAIRISPDGSIEVGFSVTEGGDQTGDGIQVINPEKKEFRRISSYQAFRHDVGDLLISINNDNRGHIWIGTAGGLSILNEDVKHIEGNPVGDLKEDSRGLVWAANDVTGLSIFDRTSGIRRRMTAKQGLSDDTLWRVRENKNQLFICSSKGLDIVSGDRKTLAHFNGKTGLPAGPINAALTDKAGRIWMARDTDGIDVYDPVSKTAKHLGKKEGFAGHIDDLQYDADGNMWMVLRTGQLSIDIISAGGDSIRHMKDIPGTQDVIIDAAVPGERGNIWMSTSDGKLNYLDIENSKLVTANIGLELKGRLFSILKYRNDIYFATMQGGIERLSPAAGNNFWKVNPFASLFNIKKIDVSEFDCNTITRDGTYWWGDAGITTIDLTKKTHSRPVFITGLTVKDTDQYFSAGPADDLSEKDTLYTLKKNVFYTGDRLAMFKSRVPVSGPFDIPGNLELAHDQNYLKFHFLTADIDKADPVLYRYVLEGVDSKWSAPTSATVSDNYYSLPPGKYAFKVAATASDGTWMSPVTFKFTILPPWWQSWWARLIYVILLAMGIWSFVAMRSRQLIKQNRILEHKIHLRTEEVLQQKEEIQAQRDNLESTLENLQHTQNQLIQSEKMASLGELTAGIAHEIQNPLNFINNFADVNREMIDEMQEELRSGNLQEAMAIADDLKQNEEKISHHGKRADGIVKGMLEHSRASTGQKEPADLNKLADEYLRLAYHGLRAKDKSFNAELITNFDEKLPPTNIIPQDMGRVLLNLFNNAFYAVKAKTKTGEENYKPTVEVTTSTPQPPKGGAQMVVVSIRDNGTGIPDKIKDKIMQPFFTTKPTGEGTGLGLSLSYDIVVKGHGGNISINSKEGEGTEMIVSLPA